MDTCASIYYGPRHAQVIGDTTYFKEGGYCEYRCACDLCEVADLTGFHINVGDLGEQFHLDQLQCNFDEGEEPKLQVWYRTQDIETLETLSKISQDFREEELEVSDYFEICEGGVGKYTSSLIPSPLGTSSKEGKICGRCYRWFACECPHLATRFTLTNPFWYFWRSVSLNELLDVIQLEDDG